MQNKETLVPNGENKLGVSVANSNFNQQLTKIKGILTSQIRRRDEETRFFTSPYYYAFVKLKGHGADLPVIFKVKNTPIYGGFIKENAGKYVSYSKCYNRERGNKCLYDDTEHCGECSDKLKQEFKALESWIKPKLEKGNLAEFTGHYSNSDKNIRKSFTCSAYKLKSDE